jgi:hypothetical protein
VKKRGYIAAKWESSEFFEINIKQSAASFYNYPDAGDAPNNESW